MMGSRKRGLCQGGTAGAAATLLHLALTGVQGTRGVVAMAISTPAFLSLSRPAFWSGVYYDDPPRLFEPSSILFVPERCGSGRHAQPSPRLYGGGSLYSSTGSSAELLSSSGGGGETSKGRVRGVSGGGGGGGGGGGRRGGPWGRTLTALIKTSFDESKQADVGLDVIENCIDNFNTLHCALTISRVSHMSEEACKTYLLDPRWSTLMARLRDIAPSGSPRDVAQTANGLARFKGRMRLPDGLMQALHEQARQTWTGMNPLELALIVNGFANLPQPPGNSYWKGYEDLVLSQVEEFNPQGLSMILNGFSKLGYVPSKAFLEVFEARLLAIMDVCKAQEFANVMNAFGKLDYQPSEAFLSFFESLTSNKLHLFKPQELSMTLNALGKMRYRPKDSYLAQCESLAIRFSTLGGGKGNLVFKPQESAIVINAFTKFPDYEIQDPAYFKISEAYGMARVQFYRAQEISNTIHGLGRLGYNPSAAFCDAFIQHARDIMASSSRGVAAAAVQKGGHHNRASGEVFKTQELANLCNGLAKFTYRPPKEFFLEFVDAVRQYEPSRFTPQELSNIMNGLMRLGHRPDDAFLNGVVANMRGRLQDFNAQEIGMTLHALGRMLFYPGEDFMAACVAEFPCRTAPLQPVAMMLNSFARLGWLPPDEVIQEMDDCVEAAVRNGTCGAPEIAQVLNAMAHLNHVPSRSFLKCVKDLILEQKDSLDLSAIAVLLWSFSVIGVTGVKGFMTEMVNVACRRIEGESLDEAIGSNSRLGGRDGGGGAAAPDSSSSSKVVRGSLLSSPSTASPSEWLTFDLPTLGEETLEPASVMCIRQLMLTRRFLGTLASKPPEALLKRLDELLQHEWQALSSEKCEPNPSKLHQDVVAVLTRDLGLSCKIEVEDEGYVLDIVVQPPRPGLLPAVIEVDGPHHFFRNAPRRPMGFTRFKHDMLIACRKQQWGAVVSVSQLEWMEKKDPGSRAALLRDKLRGSGLLENNE